MRVRVMVRVRVRAMLRCPLFVNNVERCNVKFRVKNRLKVKVTITG